LDRKLQVGVVGLRRGLTLARQGKAVGMEIVAVCDLDSHQLQLASEALGADELVCKQFADAICSGEPPYFDVYRGVSASLVGICGLRSLLRGSVPVTIPDLRQEDVRNEYESDDWNGLEGLTK